MENVDSKSTLFEKIISYRGRIAELAIGLTANKILSTLAFDYFLYPFIIYKFGILRGGVAMTALSFIACFLTMKFYDWSKRDWLGIEAIKSLKEYKGNTKAGHLISRIMKKGDLAAFLFLSLYYDPFITTAYMRHGAYNGMSKRDWKIFIGSLILGNAYWTLACFMGITLVAWGWHLLRG